MKRLLLAGVALAVVTAPAAAADLATKYPVKAVAAPAFSWTGFYVGANAGYGGDSSSITEIVKSNSCGKDYWQDQENVLKNNSGTCKPVQYYGAETDIAGGFAGGQIGYNYQFSNNVVLGVEADLQWSGIDGSNGVSQGLWSYGRDVSVDYFGTIRARLGYAFDRFLPYITGGAAYGKVNVSAYNALDAIPQRDFAQSASATNWGWTLGFGGEYAFTNNWILRAEYLYVDLGTVNYTFATPSTDWWWFNTPDIRTGSADAKFHTVRIAVSYKF